MGLAVADLACRRGGRRVLGGVSFALAPGEAALLRGPNGAGKSTLLRALAGLLPPEGGRVALDGLALGADPDAWFERVAYAGHLDAVKPQLGVAENLAFWAGLFGAQAGAVEAALDGFGLGPLAERPAYACSAGQKRRLGLARLLVAPRRLWLLDEPTVALDSEAADALTGHVRAHLAGGGMALIATHVTLPLEGAREIRLATRAPAATDPFLAGSFG
jgi:heme exporter protein A